MEICFSTFFNMRITVNLLLLSSFLPKWKFLLLFGNSCSYPVLERYDMWHHSKVLGIYNGFCAMGVNRLQSGGRDECQVEKYHRGYLGGAAHNTWLQFSDAGIQQAVTRQKKMDLWRTSGCFVRSDEGQPCYMIVSCDPTICSEHTVQLRSQKLHCAKGGWDGGFNGLNRRQRRSQTQLLAFFTHCKYTLVVHTSECGEGCHHKN